MRIATVAVTLTMLASGLVAQEQKRPVDWKVRFDRANAKDADLSFVDMAPGWHITTGPAGILYNPANASEGEFRIKSKIFLFDPGRRHREAYGIFFGGQNLDGDGQAYSYFLIRDTGEFLIKVRKGGTTETVVAWTATDALARHPGGDARVENSIAVECGSETVDFFINGEKVTSVPRRNLDVDGIVGLRVNHALNLHVAELTIEKM